MRGAGEGAGDESERGKRVRRRPMIHVRHQLTRLPLFCSLRGLDNRAPAGGARERGRERKRGRERETGREIEEMSRKLKDVKIEEMAHNVHTYILYTSVRIRLIYTSVCIRCVDVLRIRVRESEREVRRFTEDTCARESARARERERERQKEREAERARGASERARARERERESARARERERESGGVPKIRVQILWRKRPSAALIVRFLLSAARRAFAAAAHTRHAAIADADSVSAAVVRQEC